MTDGQNGVGVLLKDAQQFMLEKKGILRAIDDDDYSMWLYDPDCVISFHNEDGDTITSAFDFGIYYSGRGDGPLPLWVSYTPVKNLEGILERKAWDSDDLVDLVDAYCHEYGFLAPHLDDMVRVFYG